MKGTDLSINTKALHVNTKISENIFLNEVDGLCMLACCLVPRNIPVSAYVNLSFPFDVTATTFLQRFNMEINSMASNYRLDHSYSSALKC